MTSSPDSRFELPDTVEAIEFYYEQGLTDGLPVIPPTEERVLQFLEAAGVEPTEVIGTRPSRNWIVTADKVAINAIMAGCLPEYAPVVVASIRALLRPEFNASAISETAGTSAPMIMVNGPIRHELDINSGWNLFGPGWRANATIGRALRLVLINVCNEVPGVRDKSTFGQAGRYTSCIAENEEASPWQPYHVEKGFPIESNTTGLFAVFPPMEIYNQSDNQPEQILESLCHIIAADDNCQGELVLILSPEHAQTIASAGWSKDQVKEYMVGRITDLYPKLSIQAEKVGPAAARFGSTPTEARDTGGRRSSGDSGPVVPIRAEGIILLVAGGEGGGHSSILPTWGRSAIAHSVIEPITIAPR